MHGCMHACRGKSRLEGSLTALGGWSWLEREEIMRRWGHIGGGGLHCRPTEPQRQKPREVSMLGGLLEVESWMKLGEVG